MIEFGPIDGPRFVRCEACGSVMPVPDPARVEDGVDVEDGALRCFVETKRYFPGVGDMRVQTPRGDPYLGGL